MEALGPQGSEKVKSFVSTYKPRDCFPAWVIFGKLTSQNTEHQYGHVFGDFPKANYFIALRNMGVELVGVRYWVLDPTQKKRGVGR